MNLRFLETFVWVARLKSFTVTAEKLHTTQAAISHRIANLERELGVRLFERDTREVRLTPQGSNALEYAERIVQATANFRRRLCDPLQMCCRIRIGVIDTIVFSWLPQLIDCINRSYPNVMLELSGNTSRLIAEEVLAAKVDLGLLMGPVESPGLTNIELCTFGCVWVANSRLAAALDADVIEVADLARFSILSFPSGSKPHQALVDYFRDADPDALRIHTAFLPALIRLASRGLGVAALPAVAVQREIAEGTLTVLNVNSKPPSLTCHAVFQDSNDQPLRGLIAAMARNSAELYFRTLGPGCA
jgi:DNA-binding transcriptional LysR family regulator